MRAIPGAELPLQPGLGPHGAVTYLDTTRLQADTRFAPQYDLDQAVADYASWLTNDHAPRSPVASNSIWTAFGARKMKLGM
jgi:hypothetical protein